MLSAKAVEVGIEASDMHPLLLWLVASPGPLSQKLRKCDFVLQVSIDQVGTCPLEPNKTADGFRCDQFGSVCRVWECTDIFTLEDDDITVLKWSDQVRSSE